MSKMIDNVPEIGDEIEVTKKTSKYWRCRGVVVEKSATMVSFKHTNGRRFSVAKTSVTVTKKANLPKSPAPHLAQQSPEHHMFVFVFTDEGKMTSREQVLHEMKELSFEDLMVVVRETFEDAVEYIRTEIEEQLDQDCFVYCVMPDKSVIEVKVGKFEYVKLV